MQSALKRCTCFRFLTPPTIATQMLSVACVAAVSFCRRKGRRSTPGLSKKWGKVGRVSEKREGVRIKGIDCSEFASLVTSSSRRDTRNLTFMYNPTSATRQDHYIWQSPRKRSNFLFRKGWKIFPKTANSSISRPSLLEGHFMFCY